MILLNSPAQDQKVCPFALTPENRKIGLQTLKFRQNEPPGQLGLGNATGRVPRGNPSDSNFDDKEIKVTAICEERDQSDDNFDKEVSLVAAILTDTVFKGWDTTLGE